MTRGSRVGAVALGAVAVVVVALVGIELGGRLAIERVALAELRSQGVAGHVDVNVGSGPWRPTFWRAYLGGTLDQVQVQLRDAQIYSLPIERADYVLDDLDVDLSARDATVAVSGLRSGSVKVTIDPVALGEDLGVDVSVDRGELFVGDPAERATLGVDGTDLAVRGDGVPEGELRLAAVDPRMLPCRPDVELRDERIVLACSGTKLPGVLATPLGSQVAAQGSGPAQLQSPATTVADGEG